MPTSDLAVLAVLPAAIWISIAYVARSTDGFASRLRAAWRARTKRDLIEGAQSWVTYGLIVFAFVLVGVIVSSRAQQPHVLPEILKASHWGRASFHGIILGLALVGVILIFRRYFPEAKKFSLVIMAGIASPPFTRVAALLFVAFTEEIWRAVCVTALMADRFSGPQALIATSAAYFLAYLPWRASIAISEGIVGAALAGLYLWSGSVFVPFAAHVVVVGQTLLYAVVAAPDSEASNIHRRPFTRCPACGMSLGIRQVSFNVSESFFCPTCNARVTSSDRRRWFLRWGFVFVNTLLMFATLDIFPGAIRNNTIQAWLSFGVMLFANFGLWSVLLVVFPPKLVCGDADFLRLNLEDRNAARRDERKNDEPSIPTPKH